jgi:hypothetical protein
MRKRKRKTKRIYHRLVFWLGIVVLGSVVGLAIQFTRAWVEPTDVAPGGNIAAPINTGAVTQTKHGGDICVDTNNDGTSEACISNAGGVPDGTVAMWTGPLSTIPSGWVLCDGQHGTPNLSDRFIRSVSVGENPGAWGGNSTASANPSLSFGNWNFAGGSIPALKQYSGGNVTVNIIPPFYKLAYIMKNSAYAGQGKISGGSHYESDCAAAGGTLVVDASNNAFCKFSQNSCPTYWSQYGNWRTTTKKTCNGTNQAGCTHASSCTTGEHAWASTNVETCSYDNDNSYSLWNPGYLCQAQTCQYYEPCYYDGCVPNCSNWSYYNYCSDSNDTGWCTLDSYGSYGCGTTTSYCTKSSAICVANITEVGCY